ncbi:hypothetical protein FKM82_031085, partial [Ascaphus truei]
TTSSCTPLPSHHYLFSPWLLGVWGVFLTFSAHALFLFPCSRSVEAGASPAPLHSPEAPCSRKKDDLDDSEMDVDDEDSDDEDDEGIMRARGHRAEISLGKSSRRPRKTNSLVESDDDF